MVIPTEFFCSQFWVLNVCLKAPKCCVHLSKQHQPTWQLKNWKPWSTNQLSNWSIIHLQNRENILGILDGSSFSLFGSSLRIPRWMNNKYNSNIVLFRPLFSLLDFISIKLRYLSMSYSILLALMKFVTFPVICTGSDESSLLSLEEYF